MQPVNVAVHCAVVEPSGCDSDLVILVGNIVYLPVIITIVILGTRFLLLLFIVVDDNDLLERC